MLSESQLAALRAKHGRIEHVTYNGLDIVFRKPTRAETQMHAAALEEPQSKPFADEQLQRQIVVHPSREEFAAFLDEYPMAWKSKQIGNALARAVGILEVEQAKPWGNGSTPSAATPEHTPAG